MNIRLTERKFYFYSAYLRNVFYNLSWVKAIRLPKTGESSMSAIAITAEMIITIGQSTRLFLTPNEWEAMPELVQSLPANDARKIARLCGMDCGKAKLIKALAE